MVVDSRAGLTPLDADLARLLRQTGKPLAVAANKVDTARQEADAAPFFELGVPVFPVSAEHGLGVDELLELSGLNSSEALAALLELEMKGIIRQMPGKNFVKVLL